MKLTDEQILGTADYWFVTGENQRRSDGYYYRSLGTPSNVRGSDLIEFARAIIAAIEQAPASVAESPRYSPEDEVLVFEEWQRRSSDDLWGTWASIGGTAWEAWKARAEIAIIDAAPPLLVPHQQLPKQTTATAGRAARGVPLSLPRAD